MTIHKVKKYKIDILLKSIRWGKSELARELWVTTWAIHKIMDRWVKTIWVKKKYTSCYNRCFNTNYTHEELFSLEE